MAKGFGVKGRRLEMPPRAHDPMQDMRRLILWETAMMVASPDGFASDLWRDLDNGEPAWIVCCEWNQAKSGGSVVLDSKREGANRHGEIAHVLM
jgi:hypothetical protein